MDTDNLSSTNDTINSPIKINIGRKIEMIVNGIPNKDVLRNFDDKNLIDERDKIRKHFNKEYVNKDNIITNKKKNHFICLATESIVDKHLIPQIKKELGLDLYDKKKKDIINKDICLPKIINNNSTVGSKNFFTENKKNKSDFKLVSINQK
uniref:Uncharacterized protein n=1 Tax=Parastrongyloides trichosuri TaxID=131310 RepID=A0A0N4ZPZ5_PARTI